MKRPPRPVDRPHHAIVHELLKAGVQVVDCTAPKRTVPMLLVRYRDVVWWLIIHRLEPDLVWDVDMVGGMATTVYSVTIVADAETALDKMRSGRCLSRRQKDALGQILAGGAQEFSQQEVARALRV